MRQARVSRKTNETDVTVELCLDGKGSCSAVTGIGFLDHMLHHLAVHGLFDLRVEARGDLAVDPHHTVEDVALVLGQTLDQSLRDRAGIVRMGSALVPMDEALAQVAVDLSGRPACVVQASWHGPAIGALPTSLVGHFLSSLSITGRLNLHARVLAGDDDHHQAEALFKALGRALDQATSRDPRRGAALPSTKGVI